MNILGISAYYHDSAACLVRNGEIIAAAQEERFSRKKHDPRFPSSAIDFCLNQSGITYSEIDFIAFYDKPLLKFERLLETYIDYAPSGFRSFIKAMPLWLKEKLWIREEIKKKCPIIGKILFTEHHESHAASAFFPSPFERAAVLTVDGAGEWATSSFGVGNGNELNLLAELHFPHSLGLLYSAFTYYTGFKVNSGEYKIMGLAPYGEPVYVDKILKELVDLREDGSLRLNMTYFNFAHGLTMTNGAFNELFGGQPRRPESPLTRREMDLARSVQEVTELAMLRMANHVYRKTGEKNLCLAGGVALNSVGNGRILRETPFEKIWIQPAAGDAGGAIGAALSIWHQYLGNKREIVKACQKNVDAMRGAFLGNSYSNEEIEKFLNETGAIYKKLEHFELIETVAKLLSEGKIVGWFQGRMEFGPRALGARSILADPRSPKMQSRLNQKIKFRESFRPFAPAVLRENVSQYFELDDDSPYMLFVAPVQKELRIPTVEGDEKLEGIEKLKIQRSIIPAVTHIDYSARIQTVSRETNAVFYDLIDAFGKVTGHPVLINTSFNVRGEPIVCSPFDAYNCFTGTEMDFLVMENFVLEKSEQNIDSQNSNFDWQDEFPLD